MGTWDRPVFRRALSVAVGMLAALLAMALAASGAAAATWRDEAEMVNGSIFRGTFVFDPGQGSYIDRAALLQAPLAGYYDARGFDANFRTWAPDGNIPVGSAGEWSGCDHDPGAAPCPVGDLHYRPVTIALSEGTITAVAWNGAFIARACGNFTRGGAAGPTPTISGVKYEDLDADGQRDPGEPGLSGWTMQLTYEGSVVATTTTGAGGAYSFALDANALPISAGTYRVVEVQQDGWFASEAPGDVSVPLGAGARAYGGNDFGNWRPATIAGSKFDDGDVDGLWGGAEPGLAGWTIQLSGGEQQTTASDGSYAFSVRPGTYTVQETLKDGWRQTSPGGDGTLGYTVVSGQVVSGADFGNVCLGGVEVQPVDASTGRALSGLEVWISAVSVPGILENDPQLPLRTTGSPAFGDLLPGTYEVTAFLPDGVFTTDPDVFVVDGRFAIVKQVTIAECDTTALPLSFFTASSGKVTGGALRVDLGEGGRATSGFEFMTRRDGPAGTLEYNDHATGLTLHTRTIEGIQVAGDEAAVWGHVTVDGASVRFLLRLVDAGEPGTSDHYRLMLATGYRAGFGGPLVGGNVQIHR